MPNNTPSVRVLDLTRSLRRAGRMATGVDRVEATYLQYLLADDAPLFGLARTAFGYVLLDREGMRAVQQRINGQAPWGAVDLLSRMARRRSVGLKRAETDFRRLAIARCLPRRLPKMLRRHLGVGIQYINVGHSNLTDRVCSALRLVDAHISVMVHDVIPLDFPDYQRAGTVAEFERKLRRVRAYADRVIYISSETKTRAEAHMALWGSVPASVVAHLGVTVPEPAPESLPEGLPPGEPYFVTVGTIEPRKNHAFLLDIWDEMGPDAPVLLICGTRGWNNDAVFARLDALTEGDRVRELNNLPDGALAALVQGSAGMLFASAAEGFGLPPAEALTLGARTLCNDLPVLREILGEKGVYASPSDRYLWINTIKRWAQNPSDPRVAVRFDPPNWEDHFKTVLRLS